MKKYNTTVDTEPDTVNVTLPKLLLDCLPKAKNCPKLPDIDVAGPIFPSVNLLLAEQVKRIPNGEHPSLVLVRLEPSNETSPNTS